jgi:hypothetical protein
VRNTSGLLRGGPRSPGRPKGSVKAPKIKQLVYRCLEEPSNEAYPAVAGSAASMKSQPARLVPSQPSQGQG